MGVDWGDYFNSDAERVINEVVHNKRDRELMRLRLIDGLTFQQMAEALDLSVRHTQNLYAKYAPRVFKHLSGS